MQTAFEILGDNIWFSGIASTLLNIFMKHVSKKNAPRTIQLLILGFPMCSAPSPPNSERLFSIQDTHAVVAGPHCWAAWKSEKDVCEGARKKAGCSCQNGVSFMFFDPYPYVYLFKDSSSFLIWPPPECSISWHLWAGGEGNPCEQTQCYYCCSARVALLAYSPSDFVWDSSLPPFLSCGGGGI